MDPQDKQAIESLARNLETASTEKVEATLARAKSAPACMRQAIANVCEGILLERQHGVQPGAEYLTRF